MSSTCTEAGKCLQSTIMEKSPKLFLFWDASLKCLYTNAHSMGTKKQHVELDVCVQLQGYYYVGIMETCWDGSRD